MRAFHAIFATALALALAASSAYAAEGKAAAAAPKVRYFFVAHWRALCPRVTLNNGALAAPRTRLRLPARPALLTRGKTPNSFSQELVADLDVAITEKVSKNSVFFFSPPQR